MGFSGVLVRAVDYEVVPTDEVTAIGLSPQHVHERLGATAQVGVLRCVDRRGTRLTALADAEHLRQLVKSGVAGDPDGIRLNDRGFPVVVRGWLHPR